MKNENLEIYRKAMKIIESCMVKDHLENAEKYIEQISTTNPKLSAALTFPLEVRKEDLIKINDILVEYEIVTI